MKVKDFRALLADLGSLTAEQRNALMAALSSRGSGGYVVALIEAEFAKAPACGHCGSEAFSRWGAATGMKRYMCNACERTFNALTGTPLAHLQGEVARVRPRDRRRVEPVCDGWVTRAGAGKAEIRTGKQSE